MNIHGLEEEDSIIRWADSLEDFLPNYQFYKCTSLLMFYTLSGRTSKIIKENIVPIPDLHYAIYSKSENRYYFREFKDYSLDNLYFYRATIDFNGDESMSKLRQYVEDGTVWMLLTPLQIKDTQSMLQRVCKANVAGEATLKYKDFLKILHKSLQIEDYGLCYRNSTGYRTQLHIFEQELRELWKNVKINTNVSPKTSNNLQEGS